MITVFDLDGTVIDSNHRIRMLADGRVDIPHWRENSTYQNIMRDSELPLANHWRKLLRTGKPVIVCTARVMKAADYAWLRQRSLFADLILSRDGEADNRSGIVQKVQQLARFAPLKQTVTFWEDNAAIRGAVKSIHGFTVVDPVEFR